MGPSVPAPHSSRASTRAWSAPPTGWWQACAALDLPGHDATSADGANVNAVIGNQDTDPISGSVLHRSYLCEVTRIAGAA